MRRVLIRLGIVVGVFFSFAFILAGAAIMMAMGLELVSRPVDTNLPLWHVYYIDFRTNPFGFYMGCGIVSAGLTFLWLQRRNPRQVDRPSN